MTTTPLRIAALVKQIPKVEALSLGADGRLQRDGLQLHMNDYCRRAVAKGHELARATGGTLTVITLGPPPAENVLREAIAFGADRGVHITDPAFAGSDTWATAKALARAIEVLGGFDLVLLGRNSVDADTGQVPPQVAEFLGLPFATGVRDLVLDEGLLSLRLEHDDEWVDVEVPLPAMISCAERLCDPCKIKDPDVWASVDASKISQLSAADLGEGPWGQAGSPTPEICNSCGVLIEPPERITSRRARRVTGVPPSGRYSMPTARRPSKTMRSARARWMSFTLGRFRAGRR